MNGEGVEGTSSTAVSTVGAGRYDYGAGAIAALNGVACTRDTVTGSNGQGTAVFNGGSAELKSTGSTALHDDTATVTGNSTHDISSANAAGDCW
jgi:hypothetical protein